VIVKCPQCNVSYYETTDKFEPDVRPNGSMLALRDPWKSLGWATYGLDIGEGPGVLSSDMECVGCSAPLAPSGRLMLANTVKLKNPVQAKTFNCEVCGKACKSPLGLNSHKRSHREVVNA